MAQKKNNIKYSLEIEEGNCCCIYGETDEKIYSLTLPRGRNHSTVLVEYCESCIKEIALTIDMYKHLRENPSRKITVDTIVE